MGSLIQGKDEIVRIAESIAESMEIAKEDISKSNKFEDIFILAVREYDRKQKQIEELNKLI